MKRKHVQIDAKSTENCLETPKELERQRREVISDIPEEFLRKSVDAMIPARLEKMRANAGACKK